MNAPQPFVIGDWSVDPPTGTLSGPAGQRHLTPKLTDLLVVLAQRAGQVVTRDELLSRVWGERGAVSDEPLTRAVAELRKILGDVRADPCYIETIPKRGYRVVAPVRSASQDAAPPVEPPREPAPPPPTVPVTPAPSISTVAAPLQAAAPAAAAGAVAQGGRQAPRSWLPLALGVAAALVAVIVVALALRPPSTGGLGRAVGVAVLPFADLSPAADRQYFADGVHEEIITRLSTIAGLRVTSYSAVSGYRDASKPVRDVASELGVDAVMQGSVRYANDRVRVTAQLIDAASDANVWADTLDRPLTLENLFDIQSEVADQVAQGLTRTLAVGGTEHDKELPTASLPAYEAFLLGKYHYRRRQLGDVRIAIEQFQIAVNADGGFADAWDWLAYAWVEAGGALDGSTPARAFPRARAAALRALELDARLATSTALLGFLRATYDWDWQGGLGELERAAAAAPSETGTIWSYAYVLALLGRHDEAIALVRRLAETFPEDGRLKQELAERLLDAGRFAEAVEQANAALAGGAEPGLVREILGSAEFGMGDIEQAVAELELAVQLQRRAATVVSRLAAAYGRAGRLSDARALLGEHEARGAENELNVAPVARVYVALGDRERALTLLERGVEQRQRDCLPIGTDPFLVELRADPRFTDIIARMGLAPSTP